MRLLDQAYRRAVLFARSSTNAERARVQLGGAEPLRPRGELCARSAPAPRVHVGADRRVRPQRGALPEEPRAPVPPRPRRGQPPRAPPRPLPAPAAPPN